jgi:hypothetical protein
MTIVLPKACGPSLPANICRNVILLLVFIAQAHAAMPEAVAAPVPTREAPAPVLVGGWHPADPDAATKAARFALPHLKEKRPRLRRILTAEQQIVAGVNVRLTLLLRNGHRWRVTVWRKLDGGIVVTDAVRLG